jgi:hypothetical protein
MALSWEALIAALVLVVTVPVLVWLLNKWRKGTGWILLALSMAAFAYISQ